jgi:hypothetical protein
LVPGEGWNNQALTAFLPKEAKKQKKEEFPGFMKKHAAWELLSPDLRCFWKLLCGKRQNGTRARKSRGLGNTKVIFASNLRFQPFTEIYAEIPTPRPTPTLILCDGAHVS